MSGFLQNARETLAAIAARRRLANFLGFAACVFMICFALFVQYGLHHQPCSMCILQRIATIGVGLVFLTAALHDPKGWGSQVYRFLTTAVAVAGLSVSFRQLWIMAQPKGSVPTCGAGFYELFDILPFQEALATVFKGGGDCHDDSFNFFGLPFPGAVAICLIVLAGWSLWVNRPRTPA